MATKVGEANCGPLLPRIAISYLLNYLHLKERKFRKKRSRRKQNEKNGKEERARGLVIEKGNGV